VVVVRAVSPARQVPQALAELPLLAVSQPQAERQAYRAPRPMAFHPHRRISQQLRQKV
jgi:hypothetical protein